jgi:hypothetical protein
MFSDGYRLNRRKEALALCFSGLYLEFDLTREMLAEPFTS